MPENRVIAAIDTCKDLMGNYSDGMVAQMVFDQTGVLVAKSTVRKRRIALDIDPIVGNEWQARKLPAIRKAYENDTHLQVKEIAKKFGVSTSFINRAKAKEGWKSRDGKAPLTPLDPELKRLVEQGLAISQLARELGRSTTYVKNQCDRQGLTPKKLRRGPPKKGEEHAVPLAAVRREMRATRPITKLISGWHLPEGLREWQLQQRYIT